MWGPRTLNADDDDDDECCYCYFFHQHSIEQIRDYRNLNLNWVTVLIGTVRTKRA